MAFKGSGDIDAGSGDDVRRLINELDEMEKIVCRIVDAGFCSDFEMAVAINAIEYEIRQARGLAEKQKGKE